METTFTDDKWSAYAKTYSFTCNSLTERFAIDSLQLAHHDMFQLLQQHEIKSSGVPFHFLDIGCGPGTLSFEFASRYCTVPTPMCITASDLSEGMLHQLNLALKKKIMLGWVSPSITTLQSDGMVLEQVLDASVDAVGSNFGLGIFPHRIKGWAAAYRVLKEDGLLVATAWSNKSSQIVWFDQITDMFNSVKGEGDSLEYPSLIVAMNPEKVLKELRAAGFKDVKAYCTTHTIVVDDSKEMLQASMSNPFTSKFLERLTKKQLEETLTELMERDAQKNFWQEGDSATTECADPSSDGHPGGDDFYSFKRLLTLHPWGLVAALLRSPNRLLDEVTTRHHRYMDQAAAAVTQTLYGLYLVWQSIFLQRLSGPLSFIGRLSDLNTPKRLKNVAESTDE